MKENLSLKCLPLASEVTSTPEKEKVRNFHGVSLTGHSSDPVLLPQNGNTGREALASSLKSSQDSKGTEKKSLQAVDVHSIIYSIDPKKITDSRWTIRLPEHFESDEFVRLRSDISREGGNITPVELRLTKGEDPLGESAHFEVICGYSRVRACRELGLRVNATVVVAMSDQKIAHRMHAENKLRSNTSPYEDGQHYKKLLDDRVFTSARQLSMHLDVDNGLVSKAIKLAALDDCVLSAFERSSDLQFNWGHG